MLLVDNDRDTLQILALTLEEYGAQLQLAASAAEALSILERYAPDVLVSDLDLPDAGGYRLISELCSRESGSGKQTPQR